AALSWDQETYLPPQGAAYRAGQLSTLMGISHELFTREKTDNLLASLQKADSLDRLQKRNVELIAEEYKKQKKYSTEFVEQMSHAVSAAFNAWQQARKDNNYKHFAPFLEKLIGFKKKETELLGYEGHPYNALLDLHERKATVADLDVLFAEVRKHLVP